ncbi:protein DnaJ [Seminavis robusta]|uniref:Protein DnaJ n=1 Tax=Seminavis robusta TaxID=568900 RepID=A0A9N8DJZ4_9STRA|nr:protein DnaJ [Seminavis robusta]|eukprot:Sro169_g075150.1 protein DnaJ (569) ;mRNA; f:59544-61250
MIWKWLWLLCLIEHLQATASKVEDEEFSCAPDQVKYEWERLNYYEILGFSGSSRSHKSLDSKAIRKAYRSQAQAWHPDKLAPNQTISIDHINARFAQIAQAYHVLKDPQKRASYDRFLQTCEYQKERGHHQRQNPPHYQQQQQQQQYAHRQQNHRSQNQNHQSGRFGPASVRKEQEMLVDPMTGAPILRETIYEEFARDNRYRISIQDFLVESMDSWGNAYYQPLYPSPRIVEEGPINHQYQEQQDFFQKSSSQNTLEDGAVMRSHEMIVSDNERYRAHVDNCQLVIEARTMKHGDRVEPEIHVVWKSNNQVPFMGVNECFLALQDGQLMIAGGSPEFHTGSILWFSDADNNNIEDEESFLFSRQKKRYQAKLENDGKLVAYRLAEDDDPRCVWASGPLGCIRVVSQPSHLLRVAQDRLGEAFQELFGESDEPNYNNSQGMFDDDDDGNILSSLFRSVKQAYDRFEDQGEHFMSSINHNIKRAFGWGNDMDEEDEENENVFLKLASNVMRFINGAKDDDVMSGLLSNVKQPFQELNLARKRVEASLEERTIRFVHNSMLRWQKYRSEK